MIGSGTTHTSVFYCQKVKDIRKIFCHNLSQTLHTDPSKDLKLQRQTGTKKNITTHGSMWAVMVTTSEMHVVNNEAMFSNIFNLFRVGEEVAMAQKSFWTREKIPQKKKHMF